MNLRPALLVIATLALSLILGVRGLAKVAAVGPNGPVTDADVPAAPTPAVGQSVVPLFNAPFAGAYAAINFFDHDLPFEFTDTNGYQLSAWGSRYGNIDGHSGYDWTMPEGTPLLAVAAGTVTFAQQEQPFPCPILNNQMVAGTIVNLLVTAPNGDQYTAIYDHMSRVDVHKGDKVQIGQQVGLSGNTGCSTAAHLHFGVRRLTHTNSGKAALVDPYGWSAAFPDPWSLDPRGATSVWLWNTGQAPSLFKRTTLDPNPGGGKAAVTLTAVQWDTANDAQNPDEDFVELTADPAVAPASGVDLSGYTVQDTAGDSYSLPAGFTIVPGQPVRLYGGSGTDTATALHWGLAQPIWNPLGDCAQLVNPQGGSYKLGFGATKNCTTPGPLEPSVWQLSPATGPAAGGTMVTLTGAGFTGATAVSFGSAPAASFTVVSDTQITAVTPAGSGSVVPAVTGPGGVGQARPQVTFTYGG